MYRGEKRAKENRGEKEEKKKYKREKREYEEVEGKRGRREREVGKRVKVRRKGEIWEMVNKERKR